MAGQKVNTDGATMLRLRGSGGKIGYAALVVIAVLACASAAGCAGGGAVKKLSRVIYTSDAGTILPERQWHEQIEITREGVVLSRNGKAAGTLINAGEWKLTADSRAVSELFDALGTVDCARIRRVEADDAPDGGGSESYTIVDARGRRCSLTYDPGTTYAGGEAIVAPVRAFVSNLVLPPAAASRYR